MSKNLAAEYQPLPKISKILLGFTIITCVIVVAAVIDGDGLWKVLTFLPNKIIQFCKWNWG